MRYSLNRIILIFLSCACTPTVPARSCEGSWSGQTIIEGVTWLSGRFINCFGGSQFVNVLDIDQAKTAIEIVPSRMVDQYLTLGVLVDKVKGLAGVNGGFFCYTGGKPSVPSDICDIECFEDCPKGLSLLQIGEVALSYNCKTYRTSFAVLLDGAIEFQQIGPGEHWLDGDVLWAMGAGPRLLFNGECPEKRVGKCFIPSQGFKWVNTPAPRTVLAVSKDNHLMLVTVDGRGKDGARGMTLPKLAEFLRDKLKAYQAMNLDGGGSTSMYITGKGYVNHPSDGEPRALYDAIVISKKTK